MVKVATGKFNSAFSITRAMDGLLPGPGLDRMIRVANDGWGFADDVGSIDGPNGFWMDGGTLKIGGMTFPNFMKLSNAGRIEYLNSDAFSVSVRDRLNTKINQNFSPDYAKSLAKGDPTLRLAEADMMDGKIIKNPTMWDNFVKKFSTAMKFGVGGTAVVWTAIELAQLVDAQSGCFLVGPDGQEEKVSSGDCSCEGEENPNTASCCNACISAGDSVLCPEVTWTADTPSPPDYVCPGSVEPAGRARKMRSAISASAALARDRAQSLSRTPAGLLTGGQTCVSCGCDKALWQLCNREGSLFGAIGGLLAGVGKMLVKGLGGIWDIVSDGLGNLLSPLKTIFIIVGVAVGVAIVIGVVVAIIKAKKKQKLK